MAAMDLPLGVDMDLLISVSNGLGTFMQDASGRKVYVKDKDCLGAICIRLWSTWPGNSNLTAGCWSTRAHPMHAVLSSQAV
jgi:hypothetical protein